MWKERDTEVIEKKSRKNFVVLHLNWKYQYELKILCVELSLDRSLLTKRMQDFLEKWQILDLGHKMYKNEPRIH